MNEDALEKIVSSSSLETKVSSCASGCANYQEIVDGYRICTLIREDICEYSSNDILHHFAKEGVEVPASPFNNGSLETYRKCSNGVMPFSERLNRAKIHLSLFLVKGYLPW